LRTPYGRLWTVRISTLLGTEEQKRFAGALLTDVKAWIGRDDERRDDLLRALKWEKLSRLRVYANGEYFPAPSTIRTICKVVEINWLALFVDAGYDRELLPVLHAATRSDETRDAAVLFAVWRFPRPRERAAVANDAAGLAAQQDLHQFWCEHVEFSRRVDAALRTHDRRRRMPRTLVLAYEALGEAALSVDARRVIAAECIREWTYAVSPEVAHSAERAIYLRPLRISPYVQELQNLLGPLPLHESDSGPFSRLLTYTDSPQTMEPSDDWTTPPPLTGTGHRNGGNESE
jgi:hypothetical protein